MYKKGLLIVGLVGMIISSCVEHEVIPAPVPQVDLYSHFSAIIGGSTIEFTENVLGYANSSSPSLFISPQGTNSTAVYYSTMSSPTETPSASVGSGSVYFDGSNNTTPSLPEFNNFFSSPSNQIPNYSDFLVNGDTGFNFSYTDGNGRVWTSSQNSTYALQNAEYVEMKQESDNTGDYSLFTCDFTCYIYSIDPVLLTLDSLLVQQGVYEGWYKK